MQGTKLPSWFSECCLVSPRLNNLDLPVYKIELFCGGCLFVCFLFVCWQLTWNASTLSFNVQSFFDFSSVLWWFFLDLVRNCLYCFFLALIWLIQLARIQRNCSWLFDSLSWFYSGILSEPYSQSNYVEIDSNVYPGDNLLVCSELELAYFEKCNITNLDVIRIFIWIYFTISKSTRQL